MKKTPMLLALIILVNVTASCATWPFNKAEQAFQHDADTIRAKHLKYYGELIEEYKRVTGTYPFMEEAKIPIYVFIATKKQLPKGYPEQQIPYEHKIGNLAYFFKILEEGLGRKVDEYYDPQKVSTNQRPNYYMYMAYKGTYFFAVHFCNEFSFTKKVAGNYYKIDISNTPTKENMAISPNTLFKSNEFLEVLTRPLIKIGFFEKREQETIQATKKK